jgi:hypothetical protein
MLSDPRYDVRVASSQERDPVSVEHRERHEPR